MPGELAFPPEPVAPPEPPMPPTRFVEEPSLGAIRHGTVPPHDTATLKVVADVGACALIPHPVINPVGPVAIKKLKLLAFACVMISPVPSVMVKDVTVAEMLAGAEVPKLAKAAPVKVVSNVIVKNSVAQLLT